MNFDVRQKYRINLTLFQSLNFTRWESQHVQNLINMKDARVEFFLSFNLNINLDRSNSMLSTNNIERINSLDDERDNIERINSLDDERSSFDNRHRLFWIVSTMKVLRFIFVMINKWLLSLETFATQFCRNLNLEIVSTKKQKLNDFMITTLLQTMQHTFDEITSIFFDFLWRARWRAWKSRNESKRFEHDNVDRKRIERIDLNFEIIWIEREIIFWSMKMILWERLSIFASWTVRRLTFNNDMQQRFRVERDIAATLDEQDLRLYVFRDYVCDVAKKIEKLANLELNEISKIKRAFVIDANLIIESYVHHVLEILQKRAQQNVTRFVDRQ